MDSMIHSYKDLVVWQKAMQLATAVYELTEKFPNEERFGLTSQIRRAAVSIASNIAEGRHRGTRRDFLQFLRVAYGSAAELETQLLLAQTLVKTKPLDYAPAQGLLTEVMKMLYVMIKNLNPKIHKADEALEAKS